MKKKGKDNLLSAWIKIGCQWQNKREAYIEEDFLQKMPETRKKLEG